MFAAMIWRAARRHKHSNEIRALPARRRAAPHRKAYDYCWTRRAKRAVAVAAITIGLTKGATACEIVQFGFEGLLRNDQNTQLNNFQELKVFAVQQAPGEPIFTGHDPRIETGLDAPIDLTGFGFAVVHYDVGTAMDPVVRGGIIAFYSIRDSLTGDCKFIFPQFGDTIFANGPITSVDLFTSQPIPDDGATLLLFGIAVVGLVAIRRKEKWGRI